MQHQVDVVYLVVTDNADVVVLFVRSAAAAKVLGKQKYAAADALVSNQDVVILMHVMDVVQVVSVVAEELLIQTFLFRVHKAVLIQRNFVLDKDIR